jgi:hypothetical protein
VTDNRRALVATALREHQPPAHQDGLPADEFDCCADAVLAALQQAEDEADLAIAERVLAEDGEMVPLKTFLGEADDLDRLRKVIAEYEEAITWETNCLNCSKATTASYAEYVRAERYRTAWRSARIGRAKVRAELRESKVDAIVADDDRKAWEELAQARWKRADKAEAELDQLKATVAGYEEGITWNTSCLNCAKMTTACHAEYERAQKAEAEGARHREAYEELEDLAARRLQDHQAEIAEAEAQIRAANAELDRLTERIPYREGETDEEYLYRQIARWRSEAWQARGKLKAAEQRAETAEALCAEQELSIEKLRLLAISRMVFDRIAEGEPLGRDDAADLAQRIVDEIGHSVTDEPALGPSFRAEIEQLKATLMGVCETLESAHWALVTSAEDWGDSRGKAWLYGLIVGWGCDSDHEEPCDDICGGDGALVELARRYGWDPGTVGRLTALHKAIVNLREPSATLDQPKETT